jgi:hypothetical protein
MTIWYVEYEVPPTVRPGGVKRLAAGEDLSYAFGLAETVIGDWNPRWVRLVQVPAEELRDYLES